MKLIFTVFGGVAALQLVEVDRHGFWGCEETWTWQDPSGRFARVQLKTPDKMPKARLSRPARSAMLCAPSRSAGLSGSLLSGLCWSHVGSFGAICQYKRLCHGLQLGHAAIQLDMQVPSFMNLHDSAM